MLNTYPFGYLRLSLRIVILFTLQSLSAKNCSISFLSALKCTFWTKTLRLSLSSSGLIGWLSAYFCYYSSRLSLFVLFYWSWDSSFPSLFCSSFLTLLSLLSGFVVVNRAWMSAYKKYKIRSCSTITNEVRLLITNYAFAYLGFSIVILRQSVDLFKLSYIILELL